MSTGSPSTKLPRRRVASPNKANGKHARRPRKSADPPADALNGRLMVRPDEAWRVLSIGHSKGYGLINAGKLRTSKLGNVTLVHVDSIRALIAETETPNHQK